MKILLKIIRNILLFLFTTSILAVVVYRFLPVYITPLMVIRMVQQVKENKIPKCKHTWIPLSEMSPYAPRAVMASEDQRFLMHHGFDLDAIEKAASKNFHGNKIKAGGSTISQQTAKNVFLWPGRSWVRKGLEAYFTVLIELIWNKQRIMEIYLNSIEMGDGIYGLKAVAKYNFETSPLTLTKSDCALIAATLPNPIKFSSKSPTTYVRKRQKQILYQMKNINKFPSNDNKVNTKSIHQ